jgi:hypothetical protein
MRIPRKLKISGHIFEVRPMSEIDKADSMGCVNTAHTAIVIDMGVAESQLASTLIHELIEIINNINNIGLSHNQICTLESGLFQAIRDNKLDFSLKRHGTRH